ncbi:hypothetical protein VNO80_24235 [Phaseolus coccineus]|uniref:Uncharacterized protein n=1 Tax=Phaseolus coccineus TaxID=3886 RepID=A0AAN9LSI0_PHACN
MGIFLTLRLRGDFDIEVEDSEWLSNLHSLTSLELSSWHNLSSSRQLLQTISELIPNLIESKFSKLETQNSLLSLDISDNELNNYVPARF